MTITAKIIADSISPEMYRLTSVQLRYPRFIHSELMTHRAFSRNASSSRAVPVEKLIDDIKRDTAMPSHWGKNQPGMQADEECHQFVWEGIYGGSTECTHSIDPRPREKAWFDARDNAIRAAQDFHRAGYHKQIVNRLLEPFSHINVLVSSTEWDNFFKLRDHKDAMPEICILAQTIKEAMRNGQPKALKPGQWHLPYISDDDWNLNGFTTRPLDDLRKMSAARCARVSYLTHEMKTPNSSKDIELYEKLIVSEPAHASPVEHQATPDDYDYRSSTWAHRNEFGNFYGWRQFRKILGL